MDLRSIINHTDSRKQQSAPLAPPPNPRRTSSIADLLDGPDTPILGPTPGPSPSPSHTPAHTPSQTPTMQHAMLRAALSPTLTPRQLVSPVRSMSITSITNDEEDRQDKEPTEQVKVGQVERVEQVEQVERVEQVEHDQEIKDKKTNGKEIKEKKKKPKRYDTPPIYARKWTPNWKSLYAVGFSDLKALDTLPDKSNLKYGTLTDFEPYQDLTRRVSSWIYANIADLSPEIQRTLEIEAKVGLLMSKQTHQRLVLPVDTEALLNMDMLAGTIEFLSDVGATQHKAYSVFLDSLYRQSEKWDRPISFSRTSTKDIFYEIPQANSQSNNRARIRVSVDTKTEKVLQKIRKTRIKDLMIYFPSAKFDVRISLNTETPESSDLLPQNRKNNDRIKDRVSYMRYNTRVDLTQVTAPSHKSYELELELDIGDTLQRIANIKAGKQDDGYEEGIARFLDNVRILVRRGGQDLT